jgi:hypothetical protein
VMTAAQKARTAAWLCPSLAPTMQHVALWARAVATCPQLPADLCKKQFD